MLEWLETNGDGSYAASTVVGSNSRRYHGLLVASLQPPIERRVLGLHLNDQLLSRTGQNLPLTLAQFKDGPVPTDDLPWLASFTVLPVPKWVYTLPSGGFLIKQLALVPELPTTVIGYTLSVDAPEPVRLLLRPVLADRDFHSLTHEASANWQQTVYAGKLLLQTGQKAETLWLEWYPSTQARYTESPDWYWNYFYPAEADRGLDSTEHGFSPGKLEVVLQPGQTFELALSQTPIQHNWPAIQHLADLKHERISQLLAQSGLPDTTAHRLLVRAADQLIVHRQSVNSPTVIAGYHWFNDWGRDTMISLPGLTLALNRFEEAQGILSTMGQYVKNGLLPNNFPDSADQDPGYNTIDASLWWFQAVYAFWQKAQTQLSASQQKALEPFLQLQYQLLTTVVWHHIYGRYSGAELLASNPRLKGIVDPVQGRLLVGTAPEGIGPDGIGMEPDGLLACNNPQLTWMDAAADTPTGKRAFTPRAGKPVEINALWFNALHIITELGTALGKKEAGPLGCLAGLVKESMQRFWHPQGHYLLDVLDSSFAGVAEQLRPNQIFALSLPFRAFSVAQEQAVFHAVTEHLLTPYGLRSLAPSDTAYAPYYPLDGPWLRDPVYHQGTVWSWLMGPYIDAYFNLHGDTTKTRQHAHQLLQPLLQHLRGQIPEHAASGSALGAIAEIFDGAAPHYAKGAVNQAWSVAEVLRQLVRIHNKPLKKPAEAFSIPKPERILV